MKKTTILITLLLLSTAPLWSLGAGLEAEVSVQGGSSIVSQYLTVNPSLVWRPTFVGLGGGIKNYIGLSEPGYYLAPYARVELGPLYVGAGASLPVAQPSEDEAVQMDPAPFATVGIAATPIPLGPGNLGFDVSLDGILTAVPLADDGDDAVENAVGTIFATLFGAVKLFAGVAYSF